MKKILILAGIISLASCNNNSNKIKEAKVDTPKVNAPVVQTPKTPSERPGIINILDTISPKMTVIFMKDSAKTFDRIALKLGKIYGKLGEVIKKDNAKMAGAPMAWYKSSKPPYFFEAGVPVAKAPSKLPDNIYVRNLDSDSVVMAHFYGPYNLLSQGYDAIKEKLSGENKKISTAPYEIYIGDPIDKNGKPVDPYKIRTDIVFPKN